jgi:transcriptional regulator with XRE-family HTH domain
VILWVLGPLGGGLSPNCRDFGIDRQPEEETIRRSDDRGVSSVETQMNLNTEKLKQLRERRAWSQDQLAMAAGVSVRTVQRAERDGTASRETKVCLAAALGIPHGDLDASQEEAPLAVVSPAPVLNVSEKTRAIFQHAELTGVGMAMGTFIYSAVTKGVTAETWMKSIFIGGFVFVIYAILRRLMRMPASPPA